MNEKWNKKYAQSSLPLFGNKPSFICKQSLAIDTQALSPCLFIGYGEGRNSRYLATSDITVTAIDFSEIATSKARDADYKSGLKITRMVADASKWSAGDQKFKCCFMIFVHVAAKERERQFFPTSIACYMRVLIFLWRAFLTRISSIALLALLIWVYFMMQKPLYISYPPSS